MKVLVTGSAGFAGSHFVEHILKNTDWEVVGLDSFKHKGDSLRVQHDKRYKMYTCDLATPISYRLLKLIGRVDYIVNYASQSHVERSIESPVEFVQNNVNLALYALQMAQIVRPKKFIQISTDEVYGAAPQKTLHGEWEHHLPSNPYAASKSAQEAIAISYWRTYGTPIIITNTMNLFGERQDPEKYIPMCISKIVKGEEITIHGTKEFIGSRFYLHCRNQSDAILYLLREIQPIVYFDDPHHVVKPSKFNVVGEIELNNLEVAQKISEIIGKPLKYKLVDFHQARPGHDRRYALDGSLLQKAGWKQPLNFQQSLEKMVKWTLEHPEWMI